MSRTRSITALTLLACVACSSPAEPSAEPALTGISAQRAAIAYGAIDGVSDDFMITPDGTGGTVNSTCPRGGSVRSTTTTSAGNTIRGAVVFNACAVADTAGQVWTFTSLPQLTVSVTSTETASALSLSGTTTGTLRVESAQARGSCGIDMRSDIVLTLVAPLQMRVRQVGQVCGQVVDTTWTESY